MMVAAGAGQHLHELHGGLEVAGQARGRLVDLEAASQVDLLGGDAHRAVVGVASAHAQAANGLQGRVGHRHPVRAQREGFDVVSFAPRFAGQSVAERWLQPALLITLLYRSGAPGDPRVDHALDELAFHCNSVRLLGSYAQARKRG